MGLGQVRSGPFGSECNNYPAGITEAKGRDYQNELKPGGGGSSLYCYSWGGG